MDILFKIGRPFLMNTNSFDFNFKKFTHKHFAFCQRLILYKFKCKNRWVFYLGGKIWRPIDLFASLWRSVQHCWCFVQSWNSESFRLVTPKNDTTQTNCRFVDIHSSALQTELTVALEELLKEGSEIYAGMKEKIAALSEKFGESALNACGELKMAIAGIRSELV